MRDGATQIGVAVAQVGAEREIGNCHFRWREILKDLDSVANRNIILTVQSFGKSEILEAVSLADETAWIEQVTEFVRNFVQKDRRERWLYLLLQKLDKIYADSHKLHGHLDWSSCASIEDGSQLNPKAKGIYYDFKNAPINLTVAEAFVVGPCKDGLFLITPGELAVYFFHENEIVLCKHQRCRSISTPR